jgi:hypothetical protein
MKRLCAVLSLVLLLCFAALPAIARADDPPAPAPEGWTWDESAVPPSADDPPAPAPEGWTWDESAVPPNASVDGWTWDEV